MISAIVNFCGLKMQNFCGEYLQSIERACCRMHNFNEKHLQVIENVGCRCKICEGSILKY